MSKNELKAIISYAKRFGYMKVPFTLVYELWANNYNPEQQSGII